MGNVGATTGKEFDHIEDGDLKTVEELRGAYKDMHKAKLSLNEKATVQGVQTEIKVLRDMVDKSNEQMNRLVGLYSTMRAEFDQFKQQRIKELNVRIAGGSTTPEDMDGDQH